MDACNVLCACSNQSAKGNWKKYIAKLGHPSPGAPSRHPPCVEERGRMNNLEQSSFYTLLATPLLGVTTGLGGLLPSAGLIVVVKRTPVGCCILWLTVQRPVLSWYNEGANEGAVFSVTSPPTNKCGHMTNTPQLHTDSSHHPTCVICWNTSRPYLTRSAQSASWLLRVQSSLYSVFTKTHRINLRLFFYLF